MKKTLYLILVIILVLILNSCDSSTSSSDDKVTYSGVVKLIDLDGNETVSDEVTVAVFEKDMDDVAWDYRVNNPILVTTTNEFGEFSYKAKERENYYTYFLKEGYSIKSFNQNNLPENILLYEDLVVEGTITEQIILEGKSDLLVTDDVIFTETASLIIQETSQIRIAPGKKITVYGSVDFQDPVDITSNDKSYSYGEDQISEFLSFEITPTANIQTNTIDNLKCSLTNYGFVIRKDNIQISNSIFVNSSNGLYILNSSGHILTHITAKNIKNESNGGIYLDFVENATISRCLLQGNYNGVKVKEVRNVDINNTLFENNSAGYLSYYSTGVVTNNSFEKNDYGLELLANRGAGVLTIKYNKIEYSDVGVYQHEAGSWNTFNSMIINNNNFIDVDTFIKYDSSGIQQDLDAKNNYFDGLAAESSIQDRIIDTTWQDYGFIDVNIIPFKTRPISGAGIIQE